MILVAGLPPLAETRIVPKAEVTLAEQAATKRPLSAIDKVKSSWFIAARFPLS